MQSSGDIWKLAPQSIFKLNFNEAIFSESNSSWFGAIIRNDKGKVMAAMPAKGPSVSNSEEAKLLACRKAKEFSTNAGFSELVVSGDIANVMKAISSSMANQSLLGNVVEDVHQFDRPKTY